MAPIELQGLVVAILGLLGPSEMPVQITQVTHLVRQLQLVADAATDRDRFLPQRLGRLVAIPVTLDVGQQGETAGGCLKLAVVCFATRVR